MKAAIDIHEKVIFVNNDVVQGAGEFKRLNRDGKMQHYIRSD